jgi:hypothetical protein
MCTNALIRDSFINVWARVMDHVTVERTERNMYLSVTARQRLVPAA